MRSETIDLSLIDQKMSVDKLMLVYTWTIKLILENNEICLKISEDTLALKTLSSQGKIVLDMASIVYFTFQ